MANIERLKTGIDGLDNMLTGGVPLHNHTIITGGPGCGKTLLSFEILYNNARDGIPGTFIAFEERPQDVLRNAKNAFAELDDIDDLIEKKMLNIVGEEMPQKIESGETEEPTYAFGNIVSYVEDVIRQTGSKAVVLDSISLIKLMLGEKLTYRKSMISLMANLRRLNVTSFITVEMSSLDKADIRFTPEFFLADGAIAMYQSGNNEKRALNMDIIKMRGTSHSFAYAPYEITPKGFKVFSLEQSSEMF